MSTGECFVTQQ